MARVAIVLGSGSDRPVYREAAGVLDELGVDYEPRIISAHRTPDLLREYVTRAQEAGTRVFIAVAGMSAALPGVIASHTVLPVIGVPVASSSPVLGLDALLSMVQMPPGIPVATVAVNGGRNAALLAAQILAAGDRELEGRLRGHRDALREKVRRQDHELRSEP
jgi:5-(carboxyamino)imidazole ribonucleotide mutase